MPAPMPADLTVAELYAKMKTQLGGRVDAQLDAACRIYRDLLNPLIIHARTELNLTKIPTINGAEWKGVDAKLPTPYIVVAPSYQALTLGPQFFMGSGKIVAALNYGQDATSKDGRLYMTLIAHFMAAVMLPYVAGHTDVEGRFVWNKLGPPQQRELPGDWKHSNGFVLEHEVTAPPGGNVWP